MGLDYKVGSGCFESQDIFLAFAYSVHIIDLAFSPLFSIYFARCPFIFHSLPEAELHHLLMNSFCCVTCSFTSNASEHATASEAIKYKLNWVVTYGYSFPGRRLSFPMFNVVCFKVVIYLSNIMAFHLSSRALSKSVQGKLLVLELCSSLGLGTSINMLKPQSAERSTFCRW